MIDKLIGFLVVSFIAGVLFPCMSTDAQGQFDHPYRFIYPFLMLIVVFIGWLLAKAAAKRINKQDSTIMFVISHLVWGVIMCATLVCIAASSAFIPIIKTNIEVIIAIAVFYVYLQLGIILFQGEKEMRPKEYGSVVVRSSLAVLMLFVFGLSIANGFGFIGDTKENVGDKLRNTQTEITDYRSQKYKEIYIASKVFQLTELKQEVTKEIEYYNKHDTLSGSSNVVYVYKRIVGYIEGNINYNNSDVSSFIMLFGTGFGSGSNSNNISGNIHGVIDTERVKHCNTNGNEEPIISTNFKLIRDAVYIQTYTKKDIVGRILKITGSNPNQEEIGIYRGI